MGAVASGVIGLPWFIHTATRLCFWVDGYRVSVLGFLFWGNMSGLHCKKSNIFLSPASHCDSASASIAVLRAGCMLRRNGAVGT